MCHVGITYREKQARQIDREDYRGVAGKTYLDLDGDIAVIAAGGGASLIAMDALIEAGGKPENNAEHQGNEENIKKNEKLIIAVKAIKDTEIVIVIKEEEPAIDVEKWVARGWFCTVGEMSREVV